MRGMLSSLAKRGDNSADSQPCVFRDRKSREGQRRGSETARHRTRRINLARETQFPLETHGLRAWVGMRVQECVSENQRAG